MVFNSFEFILLCLPITVILYFLFNKINSLLGKIVILIASLVFYLYAGIDSFLVILFSLIINYVFSMFIKKTSSFKKIYLIIPIIINICLLLYFKYYNFGIKNINLLFNLELPFKEIIIPLGVSFYTFQQIAYIVSIYRKEIKDNNLLDYLVYILYFPKILMGPLMEPSDFINQINDESKKKVNLDNIACGIKIFSFGLFKKVVIADTFAKAVTWGNNNFVTLSSLESILLILCYTFEIYFDFSGYSDMATGVSLMLNIELPQNFNSPYKALSLRDFWKRWHMSLTKFFTKYIYIPLGGSRKGKIFTYINTMIIFLISGLWHGANYTFILWGLLNGFISCLERVFDKGLSKIYKPIRWIVTFILINLLWSLFNSPNIGAWLTTLTKVFTFSSLSLNPELLKIFITPELTLGGTILGYDFLVNNFMVIFMLVYLIASLVICLLFDNNYNLLKKNSYSYMVLSAIAFIYGFICIQGESVFLYFGF